MFLVRSLDFFLSFLCELSQTVVCHFLCHLSAWSIVFWVYSDDSVSDAEQPFRGSWSCPYSRCSGAIWWDVLLWSRLTHALIVLCPSHWSASAHGSYLFSMRYFCVVLKTATIKIILVSSSCIMQGGVRMSALHYWHLSTLPGASAFRDSEIHIHWVFLLQDSLLDGADRA